MAASANDEQKGKRDMKFKRLSLEPSKEKKSSHFGGATIQQGPLPIGVSNGNWNDREGYESSDGQITSYNAKEAVLAKERKYGKAGNRDMDELLVASATNPSVLDPKASSTLSCSPFGGMV